jgi:hypothetical protein
VTDLFRRNNFAGVVMNQQEQGEGLRRPAGWFWWLAAASLLLLASGASFVLVANNGSGGGTAAAKPSPAPSSDSFGGGNTSNANGNGSNGNNGHAINVTGAVAGLLYPGRPSTLNVSVQNPNNQDIVVTSVTASITAVGSRGTVGLPSCNKSWFSVGSYAGSRTVAKNASSVFALPLTLTNLSVNQDNCKGVSYSFAFTANAQGA